MACATLEPGNQAVKFVLQDDCSTDSEDEVNLENGKVKGTKVEKDRAAGLKDMGSSNNENDSDEDGDEDKKKKNKDNSSDSSDIGEMSAATLQGSVKKKLLQKYKRAFANTDEQFQ